MAKNIRNDWRTSLRSVLALAITVSVTWVAASQWAYRAKLADGFTDGNPQSASPSASPIATEQTGKLLEPVTKGNIVLNPTVPLPESSDHSASESVVPGSDSEISQPPAPENGADITPRKTSKRFLSSITVQNGTDRDAVVRVERKDAVVAQVYIRSQNDYKLVGLMPGTYIVKVRQGTDWDGYSRFQHGNYFFKFPEPLVVTQSSDGNGTTNYSTFSLTLHPVLNGNVQVKPISEEEFSRVDK